MTEPCIERSEMPAEWGTASEASVRGSPHEAEASVRTMTRVLITLGALALAIALAGCGSKSCPGGASEASPGDEVAAAQRAVEAWRQAWESRNADALYALYDHGDALAVVIQGTAVIGWDKVKSDLADKLARAKDIHLRLSDVKVAPVGAGAVAVANLSREISDGITSIAETGTLTLALARDGERWVIVGEHYSFRPR